jgi:uncharacterized repeat protein (TIGR02543 family)
MGSVTIDLSNSLRGARTIMPDTPPTLTNIAAYELEFKWAINDVDPSLNGQVARTINWTPAQMTAKPPIILERGDYDLNIRAYKNTAKAATDLVAQGKYAYSLLIQSGQSVSISVALDPLYSSTYNGIFAWDITLNTSAVTIGTTDTATMTINTSTPTVKALNKAGQQTGTETLAAGRMYTVTFNVTGNESGSPRSLVWNEMMYVYGNLTHSFAKTFTDADFHSTHWNVTFVDNFPTTPEDQLPTPSASGTALQSVLHNDVIAAPTVARPGYRFDGWFTEAAFTNQWNFTTGKVYGDMTLYAKWTENTKPVTNISIDSMVNGTAGESLAIPNMSRGSSASSTLSVIGSYDASSITWTVRSSNGNVIDTDYNTSFTLNVTSPSYTLGGYVLELRVKVGGMDYQLNIPFTVVA